MALVPFPKKGASTAPDDDERDWEEEESESDQGKMSFLDHLDELRRRIIYSLLAVVAGVGIAAFFITEIFDFIMTPLQAQLENGQTLIFTEPTEAVMVYLKMAVLAGIFIASPGVMTQVWLFVAPGLYANEKKLAVPFVLMSTFFFIAGAAFAHYIVYPLTWKFFQSFASDTLTLMPRLEPAFGLYVKLLLVFGLIFQMPTLVLFLARMGVISARFLVRNMKYAILIMFIVGAVLSPGTDPVGQALMAGPMFLLYLLSIVLAWIFGKKRKRMVDEA